MPSRLAGAIEIASYLVVTLLATWLVITGLVGLKSCIWLATAMLVSLLLLAWRRFEGGRHPCFLFLGTLLLFQGGRLIGYVFGVTEDPMQIDVGTPIPIGVPDQYAELTLLILVLSAVLVYAPCRLNYRPMVYREGKEVQWLPALYALIIVTFPFALYKNVVYLSYIRAHGGYLAVYLDSAAVLDSAGSVVRAFALVNTNAILVAYVFEHRPRRLRWLLLVYFILSTFDLLIGFRGKFFAQILGLWFLHKLKTGRRFNIIPMVAAACVVSIVSVLAGAFREEQNVGTLNPIIFVAVQGVTLNVTEAAVVYSSIFSRYGFNYVWWGFFYNLVHAPDAPHLLWTGDLSVFLNPIQSEMGYGTATSYLAELYLFGGITAVVIGSILIGYCFSLLHRISRYGWGAAVLAFVFPAMIYLPRAELLYPLAAAAKALISLIPISIFVLVYRSITSLLRSAMTSWRREQPAPGPAAELW